MSMKFSAYLDVDLNRTVVSLISWILRELFHTHEKKIKNKMKISELPGDEETGLTCRTYVFQNESHTLGNALKCIIDRYEDVQFCGYTVPHPAEAKMHFRIQTIETPTLDVLKRGLKDLQKVCDHTIDLFEKEVKEYTKT